MTCHGMDQVMAVDHVILITVSPATEDLQFWRCTLMMTLLHPVHLYVVGEGHQWWIWYAMHLLLGITRKRCRGTTPYHAHRDHMSYKLDLLLMLLGFP